MNDRLIAFVTDAGFLVPSIVAARQLLQFRLHDVADIVIYTIDVDKAVLAELARCYCGDMRLEPLESRDFLPGDDVQFFKNHVPPSSLARLCLSDIIDRRHRHVVYLDGDIQIVRSILPLVRYSVPVGTIAAGRGSAWLDRYLDDQLTPPGYLEGLGGIDASDYFNSGVLAFARETWAEKGPEALAFFMRNSAACLRRDQSALNVVFRGNVVHFSPAFNFHGPYAQLMVHDRFAPAIIHFTGPGKPWKRSRPWDGQFLWTYHSALRDHPFLTDFLEVDRAPLPRVLRWLKRNSYARRADRTNHAARRAFYEYANSGTFPF